MTLTNFINGIIKSGDDTFTICLTFIDRATLECDGSWVLTDKSYGAYPNEILDTVDVQSFFRHPGFGNGAIYPVDAKMLH